MQPWWRTGAAKPVHSSRSSHSPDREARGHQRSLKGPGKRGNTMAHQKLPALLLSTAAVAAALPAWAQDSGAPGNIAPSGVASAASAATAPDHQGMIEEVI